MNDTVEAIQDTIGTTSGTNILKSFSAGQFPVRMNSSNVLQHAISGTISITSGTLNNLIFGTPAITSGSINGGTLAGQIQNNGTLANGVYGTAQITGGTATSVTYSGGSVTSPATNSLFMQDRSYALGTVSNSTVETSIYSYSVPANTLGTNKILQLSIWATYLNNSGGAADFTGKIKYGATTIASQLISISADGANIYGVKIDAFVLANSATGVQKGGYAVIGRSASNGITSVVSGTAAEDSTATKTLDFTITHGTASTSTVFIKQVAILELHG